MSPRKPKPATLPLPKRTLSADARAKISAAGRGRKLSEAARAKMSAAHRGKHHSARIRAKISAALLGKPKSEATRARLSAALKGRVITAACRAKLSAALRGHKKSEATKAKMRGKKRSEATRAKIGAAKRGPLNPNYEHGLYVPPPYPILTGADLIRALCEKQVRISALLDHPSFASLADQAILFQLHHRNAVKLICLLRDQQAAQADLDALQALLDSTTEILEEIENEPGKEK